MGSDVNTVHDFNSIRHGAKNAQVASNLVLTKIIYPARFKKSKELVGDIITMEVETHLRNNPGLVYDFIEKPVKNADQTTTYKIHFKKAATTV